MFVLSFNVAPYLQLKKLLFLFNVCKIGECREDVKSIIV